VRHVAGCACNRDSKSALRCTRISHVSAAATANQQSQSAHGEQDRDEHSCLETPPWCANQYDSNQSQSSEWHPSSVERLPWDYTRDGRGGIDGEHYIGGGTACRHGRW